jgi:DNA-binding LytR/AlgR family response regulator
MKTTIKTPSAPSMQFTGYPAQAPVKSSFINVQKLGRSLPVSASDITHLEGEGNYTFICTHLNRYLVSKCLKTIQEMLEVDFVRVHKSYMVNVGHIKSIWSDNVQLTCGKNIPIARRRVKEAHEALRNRRK